jgi:hypothetical protein
MSTEITINQDIVEINVTETVVVIEAPSGAYPLPTGVFSVFGRTGNVVAAEGDYTLTQLAGVTITSPVSGQALVYNGTSWVNNTETFVGTVTNVSALTIGTTGTDLTSSVVNSTTTPVITLNVPTASATNRGALSSTDWSTFNAKQVALNGTGFVKINGTTISYDNSTYYLASNPSSYIPLTALSSTATGLTYTNTTGVFSTTAGYAIPTTAKQTTWDTAYNDSIISASVTGTTTKTLNLNQQDGGTISASWTDDNTDAVTSVFGRTGAVISQSGDYTTTQVTEGTNLYYTDARSRAAISETVTGLDYNNTTGVLSTTSGYGIPTTASQTNWDTAYTNRITSASVPLTIASNAISISQSNTTTNGYLSSTDWNTFNNKQPLITAGTTDQYYRGDKTFQILNTSAVAEGTNLYYTDTRSRSAISENITGIDYSNATGVFSLASGYIIPTQAMLDAKQDDLNGTGIVKSTGGTISYLTDNTANWDAAYNDKINSAAVTGTSTKTLTLNQQDGGTITASWTDIDTGLTSVGLSMPAAFSVSGSPLTSNGVISVTGAGAASQYVRGDGTLADFPTQTGGGSSVSYYLNSSVSQGTLGGVAYRQLSKNPVAGAGTDITATTNGYIASYITDANDPSLLEVPGGNFNCEFYFSVNSNNHDPFIYAELYKYDGTTFTLLGSSQAIPEYLTSGTNLNPYYFAIPVATASLTLTDRIAIRIYVNVDTREVTLHTEDNHLCQVVTTFSKGMTSLNNLTKQVQYLTTGTSGTNFAIVSSNDTHTFNLPTASATNTGKLSSSDWGNFNTAYNDTIVSASVSGTTTKTLTLTQQDAGTITASWTDLNTDAVSSVFGRTGAVVATNGDYNTSQVTENTNLYYTEDRVDANTNVAANTAARHNAVTLGTANGLSLSTQVLSLGTASGSATGALTSTDWNTFNGKQAALNGTGFVKISGTTISYDNSTYLTTSSASSTYLPLTGGTLTGALSGTSADFSGLITGGGTIRATGATGGLSTGSGVEIRNNSGTGEVFAYNRTSSAYLPLRIDGSTLSLNTITSGAITLGGALNGTSATFSGGVISESVAYTGIVSTYGSSFAQFSHTSRNAAGTYSFLSVNDGTTVVNASTGKTIDFRINNSNAMTITSGGNVGIGTSSPNSKLSVTGDITLQSAGAAIRDINNNALLSVQNSNEIWLGGGGSGFSTLFYTGGSERMRITSAGKVLVGTTTSVANYAMDVGGNLTGGIWSKCNNSGDAQYVSQSSTIGWHYYALTSGGAVFYVLTNGDVRNANNSYGAISDIKLKENITDASPKLDDLLKVKIRNYNLIDDETKTKQIGVIAQELEEIFPNLITEDKLIDSDETIKTVKYSVFVPMLIKAIQELTQKVNELESKIK